MESSGNNPGSSSSSSAIEQKMKAPVLMESTEVDVNLSLGPPGDNQGGHANTAQPAQPAVRICLDCGATQTPLWRRGPKGMKTLCNACGLKYWKDEKIISTKLTLQPPAACMRPKKP